MSDDSECKWDETGSKVSYFTGRRQPLIVVGSIVFLLVFFAQLVGVFNGLENRSIDLLTQVWRKHKTMPDNVAIILIDEASLNAMESVAGRWPWQRWVHAHLVDFLKLGNAKCIVFDVLFTETTTADGLTSKGDQQLAKATAEAANVIHACQMVHNSVDEFNQNLMNEEITYKYLNKFKLNSLANTKIPDFNTAYLPFEALLKSAGGLGVTTFQPDTDGVYRRTKLLFSYQDNVFSGLALAPLIYQSPVHHLYLDNNRIRLNVNNKASLIPLGRKQTYLVNLYGNYNAYSYSGVYLSFLKLQQGQLNHLPVHPNEFKDKIVFIGASAAGVEDLKTTSLGSQTPGVLLHASIYANIVTNDMLMLTSRWFDSSLLCLAVVATAAGIFFSSRLSFQILIPLIVLSSIAIIGLFLFQFNRVAAVITPMCGCLGTYVAAFTWISFTAGKEKRKIKTVLGQYVSPVILSTVLTNHKEAFISADVGQREDLSLLFSDIRGFTSISEQLSVEQVVALLNRYLEVMVDVIFQHQGTLDKFIGDAIMAFWGAPVKDADHAFKAVASAIEMQNALKYFNQESQICGLPALRMGIGIHSSEVILGNIGSRKKLDYTVIGDGVNLTSRIEGLTKQYQCPVLISHTTYEFVKERINCRLVDCVRVKGKTQSTMIYQVLGHKDAVSDQCQEIARLSEQGFSNYQRRQFDAAMACYERIFTINQDDFLSRMFFDRCKGYQQTPPPEDWQAEFVL